MIAAVLALLAQTALAGPAQAVKLRPADNPGTWVTNDDYPKAAQEAGIGGIVGFRLSVTDLGSVADCEIIDSSGSVLLDSETCRLLKLRARFLPATDAAGKAIAATYSGRFRWQITPRRDLPFIGSVSVPFVELIRLDVDEKGKIVKCEFLSPAEVPAENGPCPYLLASKPMAPYLDDEGRPTRKAIIIRREVELRDE